VGDDSEERDEQEENMICGDEESFVEGEVFIMDSVSNASSGEDEQTLDEVNSFGDDEEYGEWVQYEPDLVNADISPNLDTSIDPDEGNHDLGEPEESGDFFGSTDRVDDHEDSNGMDDDLGGPDEDDDFLEGMEENSDVDDDGHGNDDDDHCSEDDEFGYDEREGEDDQEY